MIPFAASFYMNLHISFNTYIHTYIRDRIKAIFTNILLNFFLGFNSVSNGGKIYSPAAFFVDFLHLYMLRTSVYMFVCKCYICIY